MIQNFELMSRNPKSNDLKNLAKGIGNMKNLENLHLDFTQ